MNINRNFNLIPFLGIVISAVVMVWFYFKELDAANKYIMLFLFSTVIFLILLLFINEYARGNIFSYLKFPFTGSTVGGATMLLLGQAVFLVFYLIGQAASGFNLTSLMIPLSQEINQAVASNVQQLGISASEPLQFFVTVMVAPFLEEFMFGLVWMVVSFALVSLVYSQLTGKELSSSNKNVIFGISLLLVMAAFAGIHSLNSTYTTLGMFVAAAVFRGLMNLGIYKAGLFLSFTIGFHQMNNAIWYVKTYGWTAAKSALYSDLGLIILGIEVLLIITVWNKHKKSKSFLYDVWRDVRGVV